MLTQSICCYRNWFACGLAKKKCVDLIWIKLRFYSLACYHDIIKNLYQWYKFFIQFLNYHRIFFFVIIHMQFNSFLADKRMLFQRFYNGVLSKPRLNKYFFWNKKWRYFQVHSVPKLLSGSVQCTFSYKSVS